MNDSLRIKTYFASSVEAAFELASRELGPEAMLLNTRQTPPEARHLGLYEAVFAAAPETAEVKPSQGLASFATLEQSGIEPDLVRIIEQANPASLVEHMQSMVAADPIVSRPVQGREIAALIGPSGRGKTTTLVKLAITFGLACRKPVRIFAADYLQAAASAHLRTLAGILGVAFEWVPSPAALDHALRQPLHGLTLIDTPGFGPRDYSAANALARCLGDHPAIQTHLVLRADSSAASLAASVDRFSCFRPNCLLFTGLDEVACAGGLFSAAARSRIPVSFLANGQSIPDDLEPASTSRIVELALGHFSPAGAAAA